jgi:hypothetical protein
MKEAVESAARRVEGLLRLLRVVMHQRAAVAMDHILDFGDILALGVLDKPSVIICRLADERAESVNQRLAKVVLSALPT